MKKILIIASMLASVSFADIAKPVAAPKTTKPAVASKMNVSGTVKWTGFGVGKSHSGDIAIKSGTVEMSGATITGGSFTLDMKSLKTGDSPKLQVHLRSADFFDVDKFQEGQFKITKVEEIKDAKAGPTHKIFGDLTIKGKTHAEEFLATVSKQGKGFMATADAEIKDRTQYDIVYNSGKFKAVSVLGDKLINDNIKIQLDIKTN